jgi:hypothetical protein
MLSWHVFCLCSSCSLFRMYLLNVPLLFRAPWEVIAAFIDADVLVKIQVHGADYKDHVRSSTHCPLFFFCLFCAFSSALCCGRDCPDLCV